MVEAIPDGIGMYLMMIFLAIAVIGMIMAIKNRIASNKLTNMVKDGKLRDRLGDIKRLQKRSTRELDNPKGFDDTTIDLGKAKGDVWHKKPEESIDKLIDKLKDKDEEKND